MPQDSRARARDRVLFRLKTKGERTVAQLATKLDITPMAVRQHLAALEEEGLVEFRDERRGIGRPARIWRLTASADERFPDSHAELTVDLLESLRDAFGEDGVKRLLQVRTRRQLHDYRAKLPNGEASVQRRVAALARIRSEEGYMAEWSRAGDGTFLLVENHCPICAAASVCQGLCREELRVFRRALGSDVTVERSDHILTGARRCAYRIAPR